MSKHLVLRLPPSFDEPIRRAAASLGHTQYEDIQKPDTKLQLIRYKRNDECIGLAREYVASLMSRIEEKLELKLESPTARPTIYRQISGWLALKSNEIAVIVFIPREDDRLKEANVQIQWENYRKSLRIDKKEFITLVGPISFQIEADVLFELIQQPTLPLGRAATAQREELVA
ncbi:hypothetical protein BS50DRAFT_578366 [Corynespora cassiicola Philippines]|uniref:Uncharacterized protein n=1 Tax=Corynespora cassiicola Philippines TaxID=1448308 RepID=A0A2T2N8I7_CORCC|nr:hypothetical protein BS50DRAFT_578366 [Corynespora cassiicola Philippines]